MSQLHATKRGPLNDTERDEIVRALQVAAELYERDAKIAGMPEHLSQVFAEQAAAAARWADLIDEAEEITIR